MSRFQNRNEFIKARSSEKLTLAHVHGKKRLYVFTGPNLDIYSKTVPYFVDEVQFDDTELTKVFSISDVLPGTFYYDIKSSTLHIRLDGDVAPNTGELITTYRFFFATKGLDTTWDLKDVSEHVFYDGRIQSAPAYDHKIGFEQTLTSLVGSGTLKLMSQDGDLDGIFDSIIFENQRVEIYSWNQDLCPSEAKIIYRGRVTNKSFDSNIVTFKVKDQTLSLLESPDLQAYSDEDQVNDSVKGQYKRRVYGRVDGLRCQSISQVGSGLVRNQFVSIGSGSDQLIGFGTNFTQDLVQGDKLVIGTSEFTIKEVNSNTIVTVGSAADFGVSSDGYVLIPVSGSEIANRVFQVTGHAGAEITRTVVNPIQLNRVIVDDANGLFVGDFIEFNDTGERIKIKTIAPGNVIVLVQNMINLPVVGSFVTRRPIQNVYIDGNLVPSDSFSITNDISNGVRLIFDNDVEERVAGTFDTNLEFQFNSGSRLVSTNATEVTLSDIVKPGDYIKPDQVSYSTFYKVTSVRETDIILSDIFVDPSSLDKMNIKRPSYINDKTIVSCDVLGKTEDGSPTGKWISTVAQVQRDLLEDVGINIYNTQSFLDGEVDNNQLVSMALPLKFNGKKLPNVKNIVDLLNKSVQSSLTLDNDLMVKYQALNVYSLEQPKVIDDFDVIGWKINTTNGKQFKTANTSYRFTDVDNSSLEEGNKLITFSSEFIKRYIGTDKVNDLNIYLYKENEARIAAHRNIYYNRLSVSRVEITTDLRLEDVEIGDVVTLDFQRLYKRLGDSQTRKKNVLVVGKKVDGERIKLTCSDMGNTFNTSSYITPNDAPCYADATVEEKLKYGFITDNQGIVDNNEDTAGVHLIS